MLQCFDRYSAKPLPNQPHIVGEFCSLGGVIVCGVCGALARIEAGPTAAGATVRCSNMECEQSQYTYDLERHWLPRKKV